MHYQLRSLSLRLCLYFITTLLHIRRYRAGTSEAAAVMGVLLVDGQVVEMIIQCPAC